MGSYWAGTRRLEAGDFTDCVWRRYRVRGSCPTMDMKGPFAETLSPGTLILRPRRIYQRRKGRERMSSSNGKYFITFGLGCVCIAGWSAVNTFLETAYERMSFPILSSWHFSALFLHREGVPFGCGKKRASFTGVSVGPVDRISTLAA